MRRDDVKAIVLTGNNGRFSAGFSFDINMFQKVHKTGNISQLPDVSVSLVNNTLEGVPPQELLNVSRQWALDIAEGRRTWVRSLHRTDKIGSLFEAHEIIKNARQLARQTTPNMPQHQACLDVIEEGIIQYSWRIFSS